jgi:lysophospholipase L1-like esterase
MTEILKYLKRTVLVYILIAASISLEAQPFANEITAFKKQDSVSFPERQAILFVGSSSFRMWQNIKNDFPGYQVINRGFGGSSLPDVIRYADEIIFPYNPKQILIYCGENDIDASDTVSSKMVLNRFKILFEMIRKKLPVVFVLFVSIKPSPSRWQMKDRMIKANELIKKYLESEKNTKFINVWNAMLGKDGNPLPDIFIGDNLHMNKKGYAIWKKIIEPYLEK